MYSMRMRIQTPPCKYLPSPPSPPNTSDVLTNTATNKIVRTIVNFFYNKRHPVLKIAVNFTYVSSNVLKIRCGNSSQNTKTQTD